MDINKIKLDIKNSRLHFYNNLPEKQATKSIQKMDSTISKNEIFLLYDDTLFGGGGEGLIICVNKIYGKMLLKNQNR